MTTGELASLIIAITASLTLVWTVSWAISIYHWKQFCKYLDTKFEAMDTNFQNLVELIHTTNQRHQQ